MPWSQQLIAREAREHEFPDKSVDRRWVFEPSKSRPRDPDRRLRVLAGAYACEPGLGSEPGIGWNWVRQIAERHDLWLLTRENNVAAIQAQAQLEGLTGLHVVGYDLPPWARTWKRGGRGAVLYFYLWQLALIRVARTLDRQHNFDLLHHLTFASSWIPSGLAFVGKPFVWGPVGQHPRLPDRFIAKSDRRLRIAEPLKALVRRALSSCDPCVRATRRRARLILSLGSEFAERLSARERQKLIQMLAAGTEPRPLRPERFERQAALRVLYVGRLVDLKGVRLALDAFAAFARNVIGPSQTPDVEREHPPTFDIIGKGPLEEALKKRAEELNITELVNLRGHVELEDVLAAMQQADVFLFPSFEGGGMVVPEALSCGAPTVCLAFGGPGDMLRASRAGIAVELGATFEATAASLAEALGQLDTQEDQRQEFARRGVQWALSEATWEAKGERLDEIYTRALQTDGCSPRQFETGLDTEPEPEAQLEPACAIAKRGAA